MMLTQKESIAFFAITSIVTILFVYYTLTCEMYNAISVIPGWEATAYSHYELLRDYLLVLNGIFLCVLCFKNIIYFKEYLTKSIINITRIVLLILWLIKILTLIWDNILFFIEGELPPFSPLFLVAMALPILLFSKKIKENNWLMLGVSLLFEILFFYNH